MKKQKLKLEDLKVQSFVTSMENKEKQTVDGGTTPFCGSLAVVSAAVASIANCSATGQKITDQGWVDNTIENTQFYTVMLSAFLLH